MLVTGSLAFTSIALGSLFGGIAISRWDETKSIARTGCRDPEAYKGCQPSVSDMEIDASAFATASTFCFLAGGLALTGTAILWITGPPSARRSSARAPGVQLAPVVGPSGAGGALVRGTF